MGKHGENLTNVWSNLCFDLHLIYFGTACPVIHAWLLNIYFIVFEGNELPKLMSNVFGDGLLRRAVQALSRAMYLPPPPPPPRTSPNATWLKLHFFFAQNPYLKNTVVNKTNHMIEEDDSILEKAIGTEIEWCPIECLDKKVLKISQRRDPKS
ncbi:hypothetical protein YC2023_084300 [Brassica napus]